MQEVRLTARLSERDPNERFRSMEGVPQTGRTLGSYLDEFGGHKVQIDDPIGNWHEVSLEDFEGASPDSFLEIRFYFPARGEAFPPLGAGERVLKEFVLPEGVEVPFGRGEHGDL
jgi:hypothetical protein